MPPADLAALSAAIATVRELGFAGASLDDLPAMCRWSDAVVTLARELVRLIDAGELVRKVVCWKCNGSRYVACAYCHEMGYTLEPLFAVEEPCPTCHGRRKVYEQSETGQDYGEWPCPTCYPEGKEVGK